jgi:hypothetical protein
MGEHLGADGPPHDWASAPVTEMKRHPMTIVIDFNMVVSIKNLPNSSVNSPARLFARTLPMIRCSSRAAWFPG